MKDSCQFCFDKVLYLAEKVNEQFANLIENDDMQTPISYIEGLTHL